MADFLLVTHNSTAWDVSFMRSANDWELAEFTAFYSTLYATMVRRNSANKLMWKGSKNGVFSVKSFYGLISGNPIESFPWRGVWKTNVPTRVSFFVWEATHS